MESALQSLRDIPGVLGSFLLDESGQLLARDMPSVFDAPTLQQAGLRLSQLRGAFETGKDVFDGCTARFGSHLLVLRAAEARTLCVLCPVGTNLSTLTMGINLVSRRVAAPRRAPVAAAQPGVLLPPALIAQQVARPSPPPPLQEAPPEPMSITRFFRGRPVP